MTAVLLDTCAAIWLNDSGVMTRRAVAAIEKAARGDGVYVSPISAWEVGLLAHPSSNRRRPFTFHPDPSVWFARLLAQRAVRTAELSIEIALASTTLPGDFHRDPADRFIVATARSLDIPVLTRDGPILDYAKAGHVRAIAC